MHRCCIILTVRVIYEMQIRTFGYKVYNTCLNNYSITDLVQELFFMVLCALEYITSLL